MLCVCRKRMGQIAFKKPYSLQTLPTSVRNITATPLQFLSWNCRRRILVCTLSRVIKVYHKAHKLYKRGISAYIRSYSKVHTCISIYAHISLCIPIYFHVYPCIPMYVHVYTCIPTFVHLYPCTAMYTHV